MLYAISAKQWNAVKLSSGLSLCYLSLSPFLSLSLALWLSPWLFATISLSFSLSLSLALWLSPWLFATISLVVSHCLSLTLSFALPLCLTSIRLTIAKTQYSLPPILGPSILGKFDSGDTFVLHRFLLWDSNVKLPRFWWHRTPVLVKTRFWGMILSAHIM